MNCRHSAVARRAPPLKRDGPMRIVFLSFGGAKGGLRVRQLPGLAGWVALLLPPLHIVALPVRAMTPRDGTSSRVMATARMTSCASSRGLVQANPPRPAAEPAPAAKARHCHMTWAKAWCDSAICVAVEIIDSGAAIHSTASENSEPAGRYALSFRYKCRPPPARAACDPRACATAAGRNIEGGAGIEHATGPRGPLPQNGAPAAARTDGLNRSIAHMSRTLSRPAQCPGAHGVICMSRREVVTIPFPPSFEALGSSLS